MKPVGEVQIYSFFNLSARRGGWLTPRTGPFTIDNDPITTVIIVLIIVNSNKSDNTAHIKLFHF